MGLFSQFLGEANAAGSKFEQKVANSLNQWFKKNNLSNKFKASRFQSIREEDGNRDEDYSDVIVENLKTREKFFIECKQNIKDNIITTQFDINEDFTLTPVKDKAREEDDDESLLRLASDISNSDEFKNFCNFLQEGSDSLEGNQKPADFYFEKCDVTESMLNSLIDLYNKLVRSGQTEADCKEFSKKLIRDTTRNMLAVALLWRLDTSRTWDICHLENISYFGDLIRKHYCIDKEIPSKYIQLGDELFVLNSNDNPLDINCKELPQKIIGRFDLKFTPRFGSGSIYLTPRSKITDELKSNCSFVNKDRWPQIRKNKNVFN